MRCSPIRAAALAACFTAFVTGCNDIFGLEEVTQKADTTTGTTTSSGTAAGTGATGGSGGTIGSGGFSGNTGTAGSGAGAACPDLVAPDSLLSDGSFEEGGLAWTHQGSSATFDVVPAPDCMIACGSKVGHLAAKPGEPAGTGSIYQMRHSKFELGGTLTLGARFRYTSSNQPRFLIYANGSPLQPYYIYGEKQGDHHIVDGEAWNILDARRTGETISFNISQDTDAQNPEMFVDCVSLDYTKPPGDELFKGGWLDSPDLSDWVVTGGAGVVHDGNGHGICGGGAALLTIAPDSPNAQLRSMKNGSWPAGTKFRFGGAVGPVPPDGEAPSVEYELGLHIEYEGVNDSEDKFVYGTSDSEPWVGFLGTFIAAKNVKSVSLYLIAPNTTSSEIQLLADCFSVRAPVP